MLLPARLNRPEYLFNPRAVLARLKPDGAAQPDHSGTLNKRLPWSRDLTMFPDDLGRAIALTGVFDLCVTEVIHRLVDPGDVAIDVGANVGYLTSLMATRAGPDGMVAAFEPHPQIFPLLSENAARWNDERDTATVEPHRVALSDQTGTGELEAPVGEETHMGLGSLRTGMGQPAAKVYEVELQTLDALFTGPEIGLMKVDVEGHEESVFRGARRLLADRRIRDVVFEEHAIYPAPSMTFLEEQGMRLFTLKHSLAGLRVHPIEEGPAPPGWPGPSYLATLDPERALGRLRPRGWETLGGTALLRRAR